MGDYTEQEKLLIENYNLGKLSKQERMMIANEPDIEKQAKIILSYRADLDRWQYTEKQYYKERKRNKFTRTHEGNKVYGDTPEYDDDEYEDTYSQNYERSKKKIRKRY